MAEGCSQCCVRGLCKVAGCTSRTLGAGIDRGFPHDPRAWHVTLINDLCIGPVALDGLQARLLVGPQLVPLQKLVQSPSAGRGPFVPTGCVMQLGLLWRVFGM